MTSKWNRKEEKQAEHPGQMELDFCPAQHPARPESDTGSLSLETKYEKEKPCTSS